LSRIHHEVSLIQDVLSRINDEVGLIQDVLSRIHHEVGRPLSAFWSPHLVGSHCNDVFWPFSAKVGAFLLIVGPANVSLKTLQR
jgi:hypothetical protein